MWNRIVRLLKSGINFAALGRNPFKYILAAFFAALLPYLAYVIFGGLLFFIILAACIFLLYRLIIKQYGPSY